MATTGKYRRQRNWLIIRTIADRICLLMVMDRLIGLPC
jgi:hypothetical protein